MIVTYFYRVNINLHLFIYYEHIFAMDNIKLLLQIVSKTNRFKKSGSYNIYKLYKI